MLGLLCNHTGYTLGVIPVGITVYGKQKYYKLGIDCGPGWTASISINKRTLHVDCNQNKQHPSIDLDMTNINTAI